MATSVQTQSFFSAVLRKFLPFVLFFSVIYISLEQRQLLTPAFHYTEDTCSFGGVATGALGAFKRMMSVVGDLFTGGLLIKQTPPYIYGDPLAGNESLFDDIKHLAVQERSLIFSETFAVQDFHEDYCVISGGKLVIFGKGTLTVYLKDVVVATIIKQTLESDGSAYYDVVRGNSDDKIGHIKKTMYPDSKTDYYFEFVATTGSADDTKTQTGYQLEGDFLARRFVMKNMEKQCVAKVTKRLIAFAAFDHYVIRIAPGMDPILVLACMVVIDEELDEQLMESILANPQKVLSFINPFD